MKVRVVLGCGCRSVRSLLTSQLNRKQSGGELGFDPQAPSLQPCVGRLDPRAKRFKNLPRRTPAAGNKVLSTWAHRRCAGWLCDSLTQAGVIQKEGTFIEKMPLTPWPVGKSGNYTEVARESMRSKPVSTLFHGLCSSSCLQIPVYLSTIHTVICEVKWMLSSPNCF